MSGVRTASSAAPVAIGASDRGACAIARAIAQAPRSDAPIATGAALDAVRTPDILLAPIEPGAAVRLDVRAAILEQQLHHLGTPDAVDDVRHARDLIEARRQRLHFGIAV